MAERPAGPAAGVDVALAAGLALGGFLVLMPLVMLLDQPTPLPRAVAAIGVAQQNQDAETLVYLLSFAVLLPAGALLGRRASRRLLAGPNGTALPVLTALLCGGLGLAVVAARAAGRVGLGEGVGAMLVVGLIWWAAVLALGLRAAAARPWPPLLRLASRPSAVWALAGALVLGALLCLTDLGSISPAGVLVGALAAGAIVLAPRLRLPSAAGRTLDVVVLVAVLFAVPDLVALRPELARHNLAAALETGIFQFHQGFFLGPANEVLHGGAVLVDTASQYGVASIYLVAGWSKLATIGYGTLSFLDGALTALCFAAGYGVLRMARTPRSLAVGAIALGVVALVFNLLYPVGALPQDGPLRFGLPLLVVVAAVAAERWPASRRPSGAVELATLGLASIWSLEALAYTVAVFAALTVVRALTTPEPGLWRRIARAALLAGLSVVAAQLLLLGATLLATGQAPDWGRYLAYLNAFLRGGLGDLTYDISPWSPGLAVGVLYAVSALGVVELVRRPSVVERDRATLVALTGTTAYGIVLMSYFVDRSLADILTHVSLPALLAGALWLGLLMRSPDVAPALRRGGLVFGLAVATLLFAVGWSAIGERFGDSALGRAVPGGPSLSASLDRLWNLPALDADAPVAVRLLRRTTPGQTRSLVIASPDLGLEILLRSGRADRLRLGDPVQASFVVSEELPHLRAAVDGLRVGDRMLLDRRGRRQLAIFRADPGLDPLSADATNGRTFAPEAGLIPRALAPLQVWAIQRIERSFRLVTIARSGQFNVVELRPKG